MEDFECLKQLGTGSFGRVVKVRKYASKNQVYAMKQIKLMQLNAKEKDNALNEVRLLASIASPNVISYKSAFFQDVGNTLCILMEYANGGDLAGLIHKKKEKNQHFSERFIWQVAYDILSGLKTLHANKIIHRDIKPANIFFVDGVAKIGDLNVSKVMSGNFASTQTGTPYYTSPEIWNNLNYDGKCDIWSLGCLLYELAVLNPPFLAKDIHGLLRKVNIGHYPPINQLYSKKLASMIRKCLTLKMVDRPTASQLLNDHVFDCMQANEEGDIELLETIRCPKVLKLLHHKLPGIKSVKKFVTLKNIEEGQPREQRNSVQQRVKSLKRIVSSKNIQIGAEKENEGQVDRFNVGTNLIAKWVCKTAQNRPTPEQYFLNAFSLSRRGQMEQKKDARTAN